MTRRGDDTTLTGRETELERIDALLARAAAGDSGTLLIEGEAGIGKSALLHATADRARAAQMTVLRAQGWESEAGIPYAALLDLLRPVLSRLDEIPPVQASALGAAMALNAPAPHDSFAVPAGVLSLLALVAEDAPLVALVDDVQWVDDASRDALLFAARRLADDGVAIVFAERVGSGPPTELPGLERIALRGLPRDQAVAVAQAADAGLARPVAEALADQTGGNPLALRETPTLLTPAQREGREPLDAPLPPVAGIARALDRRVADLPDDARQALVVAAAMQTGVRATLVRALDARGLPRDALDPAERAGLVTVTGARFAIRHPLLRSSAYHGAGDGERRAAHTALAAVAPDPRLRAWHLALAAVDPDEQVAAQLDAAARDARSRGGHSAAARAWDRAAELSPDDGDAQRRALDAGAAWLDAGHPDRALESIRDCGDGDADPATPHTATARRLRAQVELRRDPAAAHALLVAEADRLAATDPATAAGLMLEASVAHMIGGDMERLIGDARRARELATGVHEVYATVADVVVAETQVALGNVADGDPVLAGHLDALLAADPLVLGMEVIGMVGHCSFWIEQWDRAEAALDHCIAAARTANAFGKLVYPLAARAQLDFRRGRWSQALAGADEAVTLARVTRQDAILAHALAVLAEIEAGRGDARAGEHADEAIGLCERFGSRAVLTYALRASALNHLAHDRVEATIAATERATAIADDLRMGTAGLVMWMPDQVEALARAGRHDEAEAVVEHLSACAATGGAWGPAAVARCRGILAPADELDERFAAAIAGHEDDGQPFEMARTWLAWGERLRRSRRRAQAREPLTRAWELFDGLGATPWATRAATELVAAGGDQRLAGPAATSPTADSRLAELTPAELRVGLMVADGHRNREVAAALFLSPKTVERHLTVAYRKLDVRSRTELATVLQGAAAAGRV